MGLYINPKTETKEDFLAKNAKLIRLDEFLAEPKPGQAHLAWVDNGPFTALAIGFSLRERQAFCAPGDHRRKRFYSCPISSIGPDQGVPANWTEFFNEKD